MSPAASGPAGPALRTGAVYSSEDWAQPRGRSKLQGETSARVQAYRTAVLTAEGPKQGFRVINTSQEEPPKPFLVSVSSCLLGTPSFSPLFPGPNVLKRGGVPAYSAGTAEVTQPASSGSKPRQRDSADGTGRHRRSNSWAKSKTSGTAGGAAEAEGSGTPAGRTLGGRTSG